MGIDIWGWVEVTRFDPEDRETAWAWQSVIDLSAVIDGCDEVSQALFGFSKWLISGGSSDYAPAGTDRPVALRRGIPPNPSSAVQDALALIREHEKAHGRGDFGGYTHIDFQEIEALDWAILGVGDLESSDWWTLFNMIRAMRSDRRYQGAGIRIVCWYCW